MPDMAISPAEASLKANGKTFHWARRFLGDASGGAAAQLYQFCRLLDDLADGDLPNGEYRLQTLRDALIQYQPIHDPDFQAFQPFIRDYDLPMPIILALIDGLLMDQNEVSFETEREVIRYGYHVAGTVGLLMCNILGCQTRTALPFAIDLGIAMQLTNIARDVLEDAQMGRRYLPGQWIDGMTAKDMVKAAKTYDQHAIAVVQSGIDRLLDCAETYYRSGIEGLNYLPLRAHVAILIAARSYRQIGRQLKARGLPWHQGRQITSTATKAVTSLAALPLMTKRLQSPPPHQAALHLPLSGLPMINPNIDPVTDHD